MVQVYCCRRHCRVVVVCVVNTAELRVSRHGVWANDARLTDSSTMKLVNNYMLTPVIGYRGRLTEDRSYVERLGKRFFAQKI